MYCKHCGKQIADDSKFCQYCGGKQEETTTNSKENSNQEKSKGEKIVEIPTIKTNFSDKTKGWIVGYSLWVVLNAYWLFAGSKSSSAAKYFQPFSSKMDSSMSYYDFTEFIVYVIGLPIAIWGASMLIKKMNQSQDLNSTDESKPEP